MRKKRRVELHIEHREISIFAGTALSGRTIDARPSDTTGPLEVRRASCPTCGSSDLVLLTDAVTNLRLDLAVLNQRMQDGSVHLHRAPSGEWWICTQSLHQC